MLKLKRHKNFIKDFSRIIMTEQHYAKCIVYLSCLLKEEQLPPEALDHQLQGELSDCRELHISGDLLLLYRVVNDSLELLRIGSHSQLFK